MVSCLNIRKKIGIPEERTTWPVQQPANTVPSQQIPHLSKVGTMPSKYLSNYWRSLDLPLINCKVELELKWSRNYV